MCNVDELASKKGNMFIDWSVMQENFVLVVIMILISSGTFSPK